MALPAYAKALVPVGKRVIDLSADFRITRLETYQKYYEGITRPNTGAGPVRPA